MLVKGDRVLCTVGGESEGALGRIYKLPEGAPGVVLEQIDVAVYRVYFYGGVGTWDCSEKILEKEIDRGL